MKTEQECDERQQCGCKSLFDSREAHSPRVIGVEGRAADQLDRNGHSKVMEEEQHRHPDPGIEGAKPPPADDEMEEQGARGKQRGGSRIE